MPKQEPDSFDVVVGHTPERPAQILVSMTSPEAAQEVADAVNRNREAIVDGEGIKAFTKGAVRRIAQAAKMKGTGSYEPPPAPPEVVTEEVADDPVVADPDGAEGIPADAEDS